jgi:hypothetical protein
MSAQQNCQMPSKKPRKSAEAAYPELVRRDSACLLTYAAVARFLHGLNVAKRRFSASEDALDAESTRLAACWPRRKVPNSSAIMRSCRITRREVFWSRNSLMN